MAKGFLFSVLVGIAFIIVWLVYKKTKGSNPHPDPGKAEQEQIWKYTFAGQPISGFDAKM